MRRSLSRVLLPPLVAALFAVPTTLSAQVHFLVAGGLSAPSGSFSNSVSTGWNGRAGLQIGLPALPLSVRVEGEVDRFPASRTLTSPGGAVSVSGHSTIAGGMASAVLSLGGIGIKPYVLAGLGGYRISYTSALLLGGAQTDMGYHAGLGLSFGALGMGFLLEARFVDIAMPGNDIRYFPISVGLRF